MGKKAVTFVFSILCLSALTTVFLTAPTFAADPIWNIQILDTSSSGLVEFALDPQGNPHILYGHYPDVSNRSQIDLLYASWNGSAWNTQIIPKNENFEHFVLDAQNNIHALYATLAGLMYYSNGVSQLVTNETYSGVLALDSSGTPHVAYTTDYFSSANPKTLKYASWTGTNWTAQNVDTSINIGGTLYLALDKNNNPTIMYGNETDYFPPEGGVIPTKSVRFATHNGATWNLQTVVSNISDYNNMVLDSKGYPHFIYRQDYPLDYSFNSTLFYVSWNGSDWNQQPVVSQSNLGDGRGYLALDAFDYPRVDFFNKTTGTDYGSLMYAAWTGNAWDMQIVGPNSYAFAAGPIAVDSKGNVAIAYAGSPSYTFPIGYNPVFYLVYAAAPEPLITPSPSPTQVSSATPTSPATTPSETLSPSPSVPEFPPWIILPIVALSAPLVFVVIRWKGKPATSRRMKLPTTTTLTSFLFNRRQTVLRLFFLGNHAVL